MSWARFEGGKAKADSSPVNTPSMDPNRHLRDLNSMGAGDSRRNRKPVPRQIRGELEKQLKVALEGYGNPTKRLQDGAAMEGLLSKIMTTQQEYMISAERLDRSSRGIWGFVQGGVQNIVLFAFDWVILTLTLFFTFSTVVESWRPMPELSLVFFAALFLAFMAAALVKGLAKFAVKYTTARNFYWVPFAGAAVADLYYLYQHGKLGVGFVLTGFICALAMYNYYHAKHASESPGTRKLLLADYSDKYDQFSQHYFLWESQISSMKRSPDSCDIRTHIYRLEDRAQSDG